MDDNIHGLLKKAIGEKRYIHSMGVADTARALAGKYGCDEEKAWIAGLLHDCCKIDDEPKLLKKIEDSGIILDDVMQKNVDLAHGLLGAEVAQKTYGINDNDVLNAIRYHTTGRVNMSLLEKIIYLADYIEPNRSFKGIEDVRKIAGENLDKALLLSMDNTLKYVIDRGFIIHPATVSARNYLIQG